MTKEYRKEESGESFVKINLQDDFWTDFQQEIAKYEVSIERYLDEIYRYRCLPTPDPRSDRRIVLTAIKLLSRIEELYGLEPAERELIDQLADQETKRS